MFSGIVQEVGTVARCAAHSLEITTKTLASQVAVGSSVCVHGVCLTVTEINGDDLRFDVMPVTLQKSTLTDTPVGRRVNLEPALRVGDEVGGHFVYGHVDGVGEIEGSEEITPPRLGRGVPPKAGKLANVGSSSLRVKPPRRLMRYIVPAGSVAIDGVSLTVAGCTDETFTVSLIPYTFEHTTLGGLEEGSRVNIETDMMAKYVAAQVKSLPRAKACPESIEGSRGQKS